jgi:hypothetical protein
VIEKLLTYQKRKGLKNVHATMNSLKSSLAQKQYLHEQYQIEQMER